MANRRQVEQQRKRYSDAKKVAERQLAGFSPASLKLGKYPLFAFRVEKKYRILVLPYPVGKHNPNCDEGLWHYELTYFTHSKIGPNEQHEACPFMFDNSRCAIHDFANKQSNNDLRKVHKRQVMAIFDLDEPDKGVQIFEGSYFFGFGEKIVNMIDASDPDSPIRNFYHEGEFQKIICTVKQKSWKDSSGQGGTRKEITYMTMEPFTGKITSKTLDQVPCLEDLINIRPYEEQKKLLLQVSNGNDEEGEEDEDIEGEGEEVEEEETDTEDEEGAEEEEETEEEEESEEGEEEEEEENEEGEEEEPEPATLQEEQMVIYKGKQCEILRIDPANGNLTLQDDDMAVYKKVPQSKVQAVPVADDPAPKPKTTRKTRRR